MNAPSDRLGRPVRRRHRLATPMQVLLLAGLALGTGGCTTATASPAASTAASAPAAAASASTGPVASPQSNGSVLAENLGTVLPGNAPGQRLTLWHYVFPPGAKLVPHYHPGWQVARIASGTLTYGILSGQVIVIRAGGTQETHVAGETIELRAGDSVIENPDEQHYGANNGSVPLELYSTTLLDASQPAAIPLTSPTPTPTP